MTTSTIEPGAVTAGRLLREAREKQGLHIAALAAAIKVPPKKLEALESDRLADLPDATFARALAQTVCRALKIDAAPVMALLPAPSGHRLDPLGEGLNTPFRESRIAPGLAGHDRGMAFGGPAVWLTALVLLAAAALWLLPEQMTGVWSSRSARPPATASPPDASTRPATDPPATGTASSTPALGDSAVERTTAAPSIAPGAAASSPATPSEAPAVVAGPVAQVAAAAPAAAASGATSPPTGAVVVIADAPSWVEVVDSRGATLLSRLLQPGETVGIDGVAPFKLKVGNAGATRIAYRGQPVELAAHTRDNIARFELAR